MKFYVWAAVPYKKREAIPSSQHINAIGCSLMPYCKFEINLGSGDEIIPSQKPALPHSMHGDKIVIGCSVLQV